MFRLLFILGLVATGSVLAAESDDDLQRYRAYFKNLELPYVEPRNCSSDAPCSVSGDFNDDGVTDLAALYEYSGDKSRRADWKLDLVILYSQKDSSEPTHMVFSHVGQIGDKKDAVTSLGVQTAGVMKTPGGEATMERPGINIFYDRKTGPGQYRTFYWRGDRFYSIDKSDD